MIDSLLDISRRGLKTFFIILLLIGTVVTTSLAIRSVWRFLSYWFNLPPM